MTATNLSSSPPVQQRFEQLAKAPPLPIIAIAKGFIEKLARVPVRPYLVQVLSLFPGASTVAAPTPTTSASDAASTNTTSPDSSDRDIGGVDLYRRQSTNQCSAESPCPDGSCCNNNGGCGYGPENCGAGNCTNNCEWRPTHGNECALFLRFSVWLEC